MAINNSYKLFTEKRKNGGEPHLARPVIVADRILSPMNVGAILRLAANINAAKVWFVYDEDPGFRSYKIKRTSSGASEKVDWEMISTEKLPKILPTDYEVIAIETTEDAQDIFTAAFPNKVVFIVGNERFGISEAVLKLAKHKFFLPVPGPISSLNVSHALAIGLYEWYRQQTHSKQQ